MLQLLLFIRLKFNIKHSQNQDNKRAKTYSISKKRIERSKKMKLKMQINANQSNGINDYKIIMNEFIDICKKNTSHIHESLDE